MWDSDSKLLRNTNPLKLPELSRERWSLRAATWQEYNDNERARWREWFEWATAPGGELFDAALNAPRLTAADLSHANLSRLKLASAHLERANLAGADLSLTDLSDANLTSARFEQAQLNRTRLTNADLTNARLAGADFTHADLSEATIHQVDLTSVDFKDSKLFATRITEPTWWFELPTINTRGDVFFQPRLPEHPVQDILGLPPVLRRQIADLQYLRDMWRRASPAARVLMWLWGLTCRFGQSVGRWAIVSIVVTTLFAILYMGIPLNMPMHHLENGQLIPVIAKPDFGRALYFSVSTLMTLGLGDEVAVEPIGRAITCIEVVVGYVMLGGLLSILANKLARLS